MFYRQTKQARGKNQRDKIGIPEEEKKKKIKWKEEEEPPLEKVGEVSKEVETKSLKDKVFPNEIFDQGCGDRI